MPIGHQRQNPYYSKITWKEILRNRRNYSTKEGYVRGGRNEGKHYFVMESPESAKENLLGEIVHILKIIVQQLVAKGKI